MKLVFHNDVVIGKEAKTEEHHFFFGNRFGTTEIVESLYPDYRFNFLKQVHGNLVLKSPANEPADAHWTDDINQALGIYTADCLPILIADENKVLAAHSGWRGVASEIIQKSIMALEGVGVHAKALIGPHLQVCNFEVHLDVALQLKKVGPADVTKPHTDPQKVFVDLKKIARHQLASSKVKDIWIDSDNTFTDPSYFSYRRDGPGCGRLISFVTRLK